MEKKSTSKSNIRTVKIEGELFISCYDLIQLTKESADQTLHNSLKDALIKSQDPSYGK